MSASREVIESIGHALQLSDDEQSHLLQLWNPNVRAASSSATTGLAPQWQLIIQQLHYPSFITNERSEVLAWNSAADEIVTNFTAMTGPNRVMLRILFLNEDLRQRLINWEEFAAHSVAVFRTYYDKHPGDPWFEHLVQQLAEDSAEFAALWELHQIALKKISRVHFKLRETQQVAAFDINSLASLNENKELHCCIYTPVAT
ncbi:XRE family transcriptional regulator [Paenibacillus donghaensis]|uniref:MmyB family transcriptional regulator n=1 Tax=Paenibacillus donghaensis TaxID=414771 RepID=UPI001FE78BAC|nr:XRE family transcriptional regulator [Paenibacillus donghaensis]